MDGVFAAATNGVWACRSLKPGEGPSPGALGLIVEILCICATSHGHRIKHFVLKNDIMSKVLKLLHRKERWLVIAAIRFIRACLGLKEIFWMRDMVRFALAVTPRCPACLCNLPLWR